MVREALKPPGEAQGEFDRRRIGGECVPETESLRALAERQARLHGRVCRHHSHMVIAVSLIDVVDHVVPQPPAEVHVEVGEVLPALVQETLEWQVEADRVHVRDAERIRHERARSGAAASDGGTELARMPHDVGHDQEVVREAQPDDQVELVVET